MSQLTHSLGSCITTQSTATLRPSLQHRLEIAMDVIQDVDLKTFVLATAGTISLMTKMEHVVSAIQFARRVTLTRSRVIAAIGTGTKINLLDFKNFPFLIKYTLP